MGVTLDIEPHLQRCSRCHEFKELVPENYHRNKNQKSGWHSECKKCRGLIRSPKAHVFGPVRDRTCTKCRITKCLQEFTQVASQTWRFGRASRCKACDAEDQRLARLADPEGFLQRAREKYPRRNQLNRDRWNSNPDVRAKGLAANKLWHLENAERRLNYNRQWRKENPEKVREHLATAYNKDKLRYRVSGQINSSLKKRGTDKGGRSVSALLAYTIDELAIHLERQFSKMMSWDNYGSYWEIDHILPLASFNITSPICDEFRAAWALTNLRPLYKIENRSKGAKRTLLL